MRDERDYYKSKRYYNFRTRIPRLRAWPYYVNTHHWRLREWHGAPKLYSN